MKVLADGTATILYTAPSTPKAAWQTVRNLVRSLQASFYARARNVAYKRATEYIELRMYSEAHVLNLEGDKYHAKFLKALGAPKHPSFNDNNWVNNLVEGGYENQ